MLGREPLKRFVKSERCPSFCQFPIESPSVPIIWLLAKAKSSRFDKLPTVSGRVPVSRLSLRSSSVSRLSLPMSLGMVPVS